MLEATTPRAVPLDERANVTDVLERRVHATPDAPLFAVRERRAANRRAAIGDLLRR